MANVKELHYWTQLRAALTAGQWQSPTPARAPNGSPISWSELFRKFNKHCRGFQDVVEVASQTRHLANLLFESYPDDDDYTEVDRSLRSEEANSGARKKRGQLDMEGEGLLAEKYTERASIGYSALKVMKASSYDTTNLALAYYAYALGRFQDCLSYLDKVPDFLQFQNNIPAAGSLRSTPQASLGRSSYAPSITSYTGSFTGLVDNFVPEVRDGRGWAMVEAFRSLCLQGMSHERLSPSEIQTALEAYKNALPLLAYLQSEFTQKSVPKSSGLLDFTVFHQLRELWRWVERLLWRAIVLCSRTTLIRHEAEPEPQLWKWLDYYATCSSYWPSTFRTDHRSTVYSLHLRALVLKNGVLRSSPFPIPKIRQSHTTTTPTPAAAAAISTSAPVSQSDQPSSTSLYSWVHSARSIVQEYRAVLTASTKFPHAGERNVKVEEFVDLCVAIWEAHGASGEQAGWVIDILWWATRLTFHSSRILRHMTRLLYLAGDTFLAKKMLKLYIQVVGKAYETSKEGVGEDRDTDAYWVDTLVFGARMLLRTAASQSGLEGIAEVKEARLVLEKARTRLDSGEKLLLAKVLTSEGIYWSLLAIKGQDPWERTAQLEKAHIALQESVDVHPTPSGYHHLALSYARRGGPRFNLRTAIDSSGNAVAGNPKEVRYWHLLGILLTAAEKWAEAKEILERGAELDLDDEDEDEDEEGDEDQTAAATPTGMEREDAETVTPSQAHAGPATNGSSDLSTNGVDGSGASVLTTKVNGFGAGRNSKSPNSNNRHTPIPLLEMDATELPFADTLLRSKDLDFEGHPPSKVELFEWHLQLRMTQVALMEVTEGAEGAEAGWLEVFSWVAEQRGLTSADTSQPPQSSTDVIANQSIPLSPASPAHHLGAHDLEKRLYHEPALAPGSSQDGTTSESLHVTIPITVSPSAADGDEVGVLVIDTVVDGEKDRNTKEKEKEKEKKQVHGMPSKSSKRSTSLEADIRDSTKTKKEKVQRMLKDQVHKGRAGITAVSRKIGHGVTRNGVLRRSTSTPNFHAVLRHTAYQASSIHSRRRLSSTIHSQDRTPTESPPPPPPPTAPLTPSIQDFKLRNDRIAKENRLLSDLWLMSAATFRRLGKIEQAKGSIQEAEVKDQSNPNVWVQLGLYYISLRQYQHAVDTLQKALFISPDDVGATVHLSRLYLDPEVSAKLRPSTDPTTSSSAASMASTVREPQADQNSEVDLAAGILAYLTKGRGWDVPEAWYYLAKAYGMQGRKEKERDTLKLALQLSEERGARDIELALGWSA